MTSPLYVPTGVPTQGAFGRSRDIRTEFAAIETAMDKLNAIPLPLYVPDFNTAGSFFLPMPWAGLLVSVHAVNSIANTTTATVLTVEIGGAAVTLAGALQFGATDAIGTVISQTASASNTFSAGDNVEIITDGGGAPVMPGSIIALIQRSE